MVPYLPPELTDHIIDYLHTDSRSLAACALTCRQWLPASRYHRFGHIMLQIHTCMKFAWLLEASPELARAVRSIKLHNLLYVVRAWNNVSLEFLGALTAVTELTLDNMRMAGGVHRAFLRTLPALRELTLRDCWFETLHDFAALLSSFQNLEYVSISLLIGLTYAVEPPLPSLPPGLHTIELAELVWDRIPALALLNWLKDIPNPRTILTLSCNVMWEVWPTEVLLDIFGSHLQHFEFVVKSEASLDSVLGKDGFSLSGLPCLRSFALRLYVATMCVRQNRDLLWIPKLLAQLRSPRLHQVTLSLHIDDMQDLSALASENAVRKLSRASYADLTALGWESICETVAREDFSSLQKFVIEGKGPTSFLEAYIEREYPDLHQRGVIAFA
ncbi:uncharacterized protein B0H18DRAFT_1114125 [Fomitopsis serialis]|uniref:uncharacterized protein n=1 Tax=Fomitopsis serialis TaxID=139415 RepID=UPI0020083781|nr:uncharacterized protein B0H18DRAFT_1114125 [Neoantrodia serialis]KAH9935367.1 hypothetical protein B0H18DRAFT_1114125 [Neoantrodia serialis]